jgi:hypothetical protein
MSCNSENHFILADTFVRGLRFAFGFVIFAFKLGAAAGSKHSFSSSLHSLVQSACSAKASHDASPVDVSAAALMMLH